MYYTSWVRHDHVTANAGDPRPPAGRLISAARAPTAFAASRQVAVTAATYLVCERGCTSASRRLGSATPTDCLVRAGTGLLPTFRLRPQYPALCEFSPAASLSPVDVSPM